MNSDPGLQYIIEQLVRECFIIIEHINQVILENSKTSLGYDVCIEMFWAGKTCNRVQYNTDILNDIAETVFSMVEKCNYISSLQPDEQDNYHRNLIDIAKRYYL